jgi:hypothetical protein
MSASVRGGVIEAELAITRARRGVAETCLDFFVPATPQA